MSSPALVTRPRRVSELSRFERDVDVLIVGYGGAGVSAAIESARAGARTLALEAAGGGGGTTAMSSAHLYLGGGTRVQKACGIDDSPEEMFKFIMACAQDPDEEKVRLYCEGSVAHFEWLVSLGVPFKDSIYTQRTVLQPTDDCLLWSGNEKAWPFRELARPAARGHKVQMEGDAGPLLFQKLSAAAAEAGVELLCDTRACALICDDAGRVVGVVAQHFGREVAFGARRGVILCGGGFVMNPEMLRCHAPELLTPNVVPIGNPHDDGSGIQLGTSVGGAAIHMGEYFLSVPFYPPASHTRGIFVNAQGQRFVAEDCYHGRIGEHCRRQPGGSAYLIVDDACYEPSEGGREVLAVEGSIEALERALGLPETALQQSVEFFNRFAARGEDPLFHKSREWLKPLDAPPFAALECSFGKTWYPSFTLGGLRTRATGEVLTEAGELVPGLFAAGRNACNIPRSAEGYASGTCVGDATFFGRRAGRSAAAARPCKQGQERVESDAPAHLRHRERVMSAKKTAKKSPKPAAKKAAAKKPAAKKPTPRKSAAARAPAARKSAAKPARAAVGKSAPAGSGAIVYTDLRRLMAGALLKRMH